MKSFKFLVSILAISGVASYAAAGDMAPNTTAPASAKPADHKMDHKTDAMDSKHMTVTGKVASVMTETKSFKVTEPTKGADGKETTKDVELVWNETTKLMWKNEKSTAAMQTDLKAGAEVTVKTEKNMDGKLVAAEIWFHTPTMDKATDKMDKTMDKAGDKSEKTMDKATEKTDKKY